MNKLKIAIIGLAAISAASLCSAMNVSPPREIVAAEKVMALDAVDHLPAIDIAVCDFDAFKVVASIEREAVRYVTLEPSTAGRSAVHAKVSAHDRMCRPASTAPRSSLLTDYEQRT